MNQIKFSQEWNKLKNLREGRIITTFRAYTPQKHLYYESNLGEEFEIILNGKRIAIGELIIIKFLWSDRLDIETIQEDTYPHYTYEDWENLMRKFYGIPRVFGILLKFHIIKVFESMKEAVTHDI